MFSLKIIETRENMKKTFIVLLTAVLTISMLFVSCSNETKLSDDMVSIRFGFEESRSLEASQAIPELDDLYWYYKAKRTGGSDSANIDLGSKKSWAKVNEDGSKGLSGIITLAQGRWDFELQGRKTEDVSTAVYQGSISNVLILRVGNNVNTIKVPVSQLSDGIGSVLISSGIIVKKNNSSYSSFYDSGYKPTHYKYKSTAAETYSDDIELTKNGGTLIDTEVLLRAGTYDFVVMYKGSDTDAETNVVTDIVYASAPITVTVTANIVTTITGSLDVVSASGQFVAEVVGSKASASIEPTEEPLTVVVPVTPSEKQGKNTTISFDRGAIKADSNAKNLVTEVKTVEEALSAKYSISDGYNAIAAIDLKIMDKDGVVIENPISEGKTVTVTTYIMTNLERVIVKYNGSGNNPIADSVNNTNDAAVYPAETEDVGQLGYFKETGLLRFTVDHFSEFFVETDAVCYNADTNVGFYSLPSALTYSISRIVLLKNVDLSSDVNDYIVDYFCGELEGNNHTIKFGSESRDQYLFDTLGENSCLKNLIIDITGGESGIAVNTYDNVIFDHVKIKGSLVFTGNCGPYVVYAEGNTSFLNCEMAANISGKGDSSNYNSAFVGYPLVAGKTFTFNDCIFSGSLECGTAGLFIGNNCRTYDNINIVINNFKTTDRAVVRAINCYDSTQKGWPFNGVIAAWAEQVDVTLKIDGNDVKASQLITNKTNYFGNIFVEGPEDDTLSMVKNGDGTFTITKATKTVTKYVVSIGLYTTYTGEGGGSLRQYVEEEITSKDQDTYTTTIQDLKFVDSIWFENNPSATVDNETLPGYSIYTLNGVSYYMLPESENANVGGNPKSAMLYSVTAYNGKDVVASCVLSD